MADSTSDLNIIRTAGWPVVAIALASSIYFSTNLSAVLVYDRSAIISGELWRLITGHWVHFSTSHLIYDVIVLAITGWIITSSGYRYLTALYLLSSLFISLVLFVMLPDMAFYGGLSGIAMASTVYLSLQFMRKPPPWDRVGLLIFLLCIGKLFFDASVSRFALAAFDKDFIVPVYLSHLTGAICGFVVYLWSAFDLSHYFLQPEQTFRK